MRITLYPGMYQDVETGLYYNRFRYYEPNIGRYVNPDPLALASLYSYAKNNPLSGVDVLGLATIFIDPGHGDRTTWWKEGEWREQKYFQPGATSQQGMIWEDCGVNGYCEKDLAVELAQAIGERLERLGHVVEYSRTGDVDDPSKEFLKWRIDNAIEVGADYIISVHFDNNTAEGNRLGVLYYDDPTNQSSRILAEQIIISIAGEDGGMCPLDECKPIPTVYGIQKYHFTDTVFQTLQDAGLTSDLVNSLRTCFRNTQFDTKDALLDAIKTCITPRQLSEHERKIILKYAAIPIEESSVEDYEAVTEELSKRILWMPPQLDPRIQASVLLEAGEMGYIDETLQVVTNQEFIDRVVQGIQQGITKIEEENCLSATPSPTPTETPTPTPTETPSPTPEP